MGKAHEIEYKIYGDDMQFVEVELDPAESVIAEAGALMFMEPGIQMETIFGDGSGQGENRGLTGKLFGAGKRLLTGESLFMTLFTNSGAGKAHASFAAPYPGKIIPVDLTAYNGKVICQKDAFLCAAKGVAIGIEFNKRLGTGFFGGEGFIMQKLEGDGLAFLHAGGTIIERELRPGETLRVDTGCLVGMTGSVCYDIQFVGGIKTAFFGGEGLFFATVSGPGKVWLQSLPFSRLADRIIASAPRLGGSQKGEGSILGGLGNLLDGDR
ncbi:MAG: TIGR00266 family protein [Dehalobacter sp.]|nr:TIGR00266 family protein [Dehalobacter sp.]